MFLRRALRFSIKAGINNHGRGLRALTQLAGRPGIVDEETFRYPKHLGSYRDDLPFGINGDGVEKTNLESYSRDIRPKLDQLLLKHGGVIFKGLPLDSSIEFSRFIRALGYDGMDYVGGVASRLKIAEGVIEASTYEEHEDTMEPHCEMAYFSVFPHLFFLYCEVAPSAGCGGECGVTDQREVLLKLDPEVVEKFKKKGVRYHRCLTNRDTPNPLHGYGSWQSSLRTDDRKEAERKLAEAGHRPDQYHWNEDGSLRFWTTSQVLVPHYKTGEMMWFNQVDSMNWTYFKSKTGKLYDLLKNEDPAMSPFTTYYGDGTDIEPDVLQHIREVQWRCTVAEQPQQGNVLALDNMRVAHSKFGYKGPRTMRVALARWADSDSK
ncbi:uncharacterized protein LOC135492089 [Lineus longissimus]|uniref:uncharacterized protein LOC135492089 n=1 Tax=Lineus longissimus TaxID=88925 RepID=UPI002B4DC09C